MNASSYLEIDDSDGPVVYGDSKLYRSIEISTPLGPVETTVYGTHCHISLPTDSGSGSIPLVLGRKKVAISGALLADGTWASTGLSRVQVHPMSLIGRLPAAASEQVMDTVRQSVNDYLSSHPQLMDQARVISISAKAAVLLDRAECAESDARRHEQDAKDALVTAQRLRQQAATARDEADRLQG